MNTAELIDLLVCPESGQSLSIAPETLTTRARELQRDGQLRVRTGVGFIDRFEALLIRSDEKVCYPVVDGIPILLISEAISMEDVLEGA